MVMAIPCTASGWGKFTNTNRKKNNNKNLPPFHFFFFFQIIILTIKDGIKCKIKYYDYYVMQIPNDNDFFNKFCNE